MFQSFETTAAPDRGPARLERLRRAMKMKDLDGIIVPRTDAHQGEYVADCDARLAWLTGFTGSAGFCIVLNHVAGVFIDGRYRNQVLSQIDLEHFTPVPWPEIQPGPWLIDQLTGPTRIGFDPWLHSRCEIEQLQKSVQNSTITLVPTDNLVDQIWADRPAAPNAPITLQPLEFSGRSREDKCAELADELMSRGLKAQVLTLSDSIAWLLNIRGTDIEHIPVVQGFAILHDDARVDFFTEEGREGVAQLGAGLTVHPTRSFASALQNLVGPVGVDRTNAPYAVSHALDISGIEFEWNEDPTIFPKAT